MDVPYSICRDAYDPYGTGILRGMTDGAAGECVGPERLGRAVSDGGRRELGPRGEGGEWGKGRGTAVAVLSRVGSLTGPY